MKLVGATCLGNEKLLIKYVMPYIIRNGYDKFIIFDDSDDGSIDDIKSYNLNFIEIRKFEHSDECPEKYIDYKFDWEKCGIFIDVFYELKRESIETGEEIWYNFMDFDEVIFCIYGLKKFITTHYASDYGFNYYANKLINLTYKGNDSIDAELINNKSKFVHSLNNIEGCAWPFWGTKTTVIKVNDFRYNEGFMIGFGGHVINIEKEENVVPRNLAELGFLYSFHLSNLTREISINKSLNHKKRNTCPLYTDDIEELNYLYDANTSLSFPLKYVFYNDYKEKGYKLGVFGGLNVIN